MKIISLNTLLCLPELSLYWYTLELAVLDQPKLLSVFKLSSLQIQQSVSKVLTGQENEGYVHVNCFLMSPSGVTRLVLTSHWLITGLCTHKSHLKD